MLVKLVITAAPTRRRFSLHTHTARPVRFFYDMDKRKKCYNSGKISGLPYLVAYNNFLAADKEIESLGYKPVNPLAERWLKPDAPWLLHMIVDVWHMLWCKAVFFQKNWEDSRGARIEFQLALMLDKELIYQN